MWLCEVLFSLSVMENMCVVRSQVILNMTMIVISLSIFGDCNVFCEFESGTGSGATITLSVFFALHWENAEKQIVHCPRVA